MWHVRDHYPFKEAMEHLRATDDPRVAEITTFHRRLVEEGPELPESRPMPVPMGALVLDGWHYILEDGRAFIQSVLVPDGVAGADPGIVVVSLLDLDY